MVWHEGDGLSNPKFIKKGEKITNPNKSNHYLIIKENNSQSLDHIICNLSKETHPQTIKIGP
jgi:hypothetical protein